MNNEDNTTDLRVKRTDMLILNALIELTIQKGFSAITVSDITNYAGINRATFYRHYNDKFDLLSKYTQHVYELLDTSEEIKNQESPMLDDHKIPKKLVNIFEHVRENAKFYKVMLGRKGDPVFTEKIRQYIQKRILRTLPKHLQTDEMSLDLYVHYSSSASLGAVVWWLEHEMPYSSEQMITILQQLELGNLQSIEKH